MYKNRNLFDEFLGGIPATIVVKLTEEEIENLTKGQLNIEPSFELVDKDGNRRIYEK